MKRFDHNNQALNLPDCYAKNGKHNSTPQTSGYDELDPEKLRIQKDSSNNYRLLLLERCSVNGLFNTKGALAKNGLQIDIKAVDDVLDIENATGKTLDLYGEMVNQARGQADDAKYRLMIKSKVASNSVTGTHKSIVDAICLTFNCKPSQVSLREIKGKPCSVELADMPLGAIVEADLSPSQALAMIQRLLPTGIKIDSFALTGTFEFSSEESELNQNTGFADDNSTYGGYFGLMTGEENDVVLPI